MQAISMLSFEKREPQLKEITPSNWPVDKPVRLFLKPGPPREVPSQAGDPGRDKKVGCTSRGSESRSNVSPPGCFQGPALSSCPDFLLGWTVMWNCKLKISFSLQATEAIETLRHPPYCDHTKQPENSRQELSALLS